MAASAALIRARPIPCRRWSGWTAPRILAPSRFSNRLSVSAAYPTSRPRRAPARSRRPVPRRPGHGTRAGTSRAVWCRDGTPSSAALSISASSPAVARSRSATSTRSSATVTARPAGGRPGPGPRGSRRSTPRAGAPRGPRTSSASGSSASCSASQRGVAGGEAGLEHVPLVEGRLVRGHHREAVRLGQRDQRRRAGRTRRRDRPAGRWPPASVAPTRCPRRRRAARRGGAARAGRSGRRRSPAAGPPRRADPRSGRPRCRSRRRRARSPPGRRGPRRRHAVRLEARGDAASSTPGRRDERLLVEVEPEPGRVPAPPRARAAGARPSRSRRRAPWTAACSVRNATSRSARSSESGDRKVRSWWSGGKVGIAPEYSAYGVRPRHRHFPGSSA